MKIYRSRAPLRISFAGGGTDFPHWFNHHPGAALSATIRRYARASLTPCPRVDNGEVFARDGYPGLANGVWETMRSQVREACGSTILETQCDVAPRSGLGGSSTVVVATLATMLAATGDRVNDYQVAERAILVERNVLRITGGLQDQFSAVFGGFNVIEFLSSGVLLNRLEVPQGVVWDLEEHLILCRVGGERPAVDLLAKQVNRFSQATDEVLPAMHAIHGLVYEMKRALLTWRLDDFASMLHQGFVEKKRMNPWITEGTKADELYELARANGALGGKLLGAGGSGYLLLYCPVSQQLAMREKLEKAGGRCERVIFEPLGLKVWESEIE